MFSLSAQDLLRVWEVGSGERSLDRALTILEAAFPSISREELAALTVGQRNTYLFSVREQTFGPKLNGLAACPRCDSQLEFALDTRDLLGARESGSADEVHQIASDDWELRFRLPNSVDLESIAGCESVGAARTMLVERCLIEASRGVAAISQKVLPDEVVSLLASEMAARDPQAEITLDIGCPACDRRWQLDFDIASFFWYEITAQAKRLLREVHAIASAYAWREADILAMSATRRQFYLEMIG